MFFTVSDLADSFVVKKTSPVWQGGSILSKNRHAFPSGDTHHHHLLITGDCNQWHHVFYFTLFVLSSFMLSISTLLQCTLKECFFFTVISLFPEFTVKTKDSLKHSDVSHYITHSLLLLLLCQYDWSCSILSCRIICVLPRVPLPVFCRRLFKYYFLFLLLSFLVNNFLEFLSLGWK